MKLKIQDYENNKAYLEYANTPSRPRFAPSYIVSGERADEFVKKYNKQAESLAKKSVLMTVSGLLVGWGMSISTGAKALSVFFKSCAGAFIGLCLGMVISTHEKNKLMDEYHVKEF